jgi:hypothetical protein
MRTPLIVAILLISTAPVYAQGQQPNTVQLKADPQKVVTIIKGDKAKTQTFCQAGDVAKQIDGAASVKDRKKTEELSQKLTKLEANLGPEYVALIESLRDLNLTPEDAQKIMSAFDTLDQSCPH